LRGLTAGRRTAVTTQSEHRFFMSTFTKKEAKKSIEKTHQKSLVTVSEVTDAEKLAASLGVSANNSIENNSIE
jgi:hypothetical protein